jgi:nucleoside-diphosphate-sugar epimerase
MLSKPNRIKGRVLVLGATGRIGHILRFFWPTQDDLVLHSRQARPGFVHFQPAEMREDVLDQLPPIRAVICLSGVTRAGVTQDLSDNTAMAIAAVRLGKALGARRVFCASSAAVYGRAVGQAEETQPCTPISDYGRAKQRMEEQALALSTGSHQPTTMLRIGNVAGADAILEGWHEGMVLDQFLNKKTPIRSYIGPAKLARTLHVLTLSENLPDVLNIAAPLPVEMGTLLDAAGLPWQPRIAQAGAIESVHLSTKRLEEHMDFAPKDSEAATMVKEWKEMGARNP